MTQSISDRLCACLQRACAHYERIIAEYGLLSEREDSAAALAELAGRQPADVRDMQTLDLELQAILGEWRRCAGVEETERQRVQLHAARARELAEEVGRLQRSIVAKTEEARQKAEQEMAQMRQGRATLRSYRAGENPGGSGRMDSQA